MWWIIIKNYNWNGEKWWKMVNIFLWWIGSQNLQISPFLPFFTIFHHFSPFFTIATGQLDLKNGYKSLWSDYLVTTLFFLVTELKATSVNYHKTLWVAAVEDSLKNNGSVPRFPRVKIRWIALCHCCKEWYYVYTWILSLQRLFEFLSLKWNNQNFTFSKIWEK